MSTNSNAGGDTFTREMDAWLKAELAADERLVWAGRRHRVWHSYYPFGLLFGLLLIQVVLPVVVLVGPVLLAMPALRTRRTAEPHRWLIGLGLAGMIGWLSIVLLLNRDPRLAPKNQSDEVTFLLLAPFGCCGVAYVSGVLLGAVVIQRAARERTLYALTDRRIILREPLVWSGGVRVASVRLAEVGHIARTERPDGSGDLSVLLNVVVPVTGGHPGTTVPGRVQQTLHGIRHVHQVETLVRRMMAAGAANGPG